MTHATKLNAKAASATPRRDRKHRKRFVADDDAIRRRLYKAGFEVIGLRQLLHGTQYTLFGGGFVTVFRTGTVLVQGQLSVKHTSKIEKALGREKP
jgi:hypothetical protein